MSDNVQKFYSIYDRPKSVGESGFTPSKTERQGYVPPKIQIESMIRAGKRLNDLRKERYDGLISEEFDDIPLDPTRRKDFDMAEASMLDRQLKAEFKESKRKLDENKALKEAVSTPVVEDKPNG